MKILSVRHDYPEKVGFRMSRASGLDCYTFLHFFQPIDIVIKGEHIITEPNACIFYSPDELQLFFSENADITHNWMHFTADADQLIKKFNIPENTILYLSDTNFISRLFYKAEVEVYCEQPFKDELLEGYFNEFLIRFSRNLHDPKPKTIINGNNKKVLQNVRREILSNPSKQWNIYEMAALAKASPSYFHAIYKNMFGISPIKDLIENRIQTAMNLLVSTELSVTEIAEQTGYTNAHHFIRQFKSLTGETPLKYRTKQ